MAIIPPFLTKVFENYVIGMLKNLDSLPLERIHNMLKMFACNDEHKCNMQYKM
jgi:hypothetical protein